MHYFTLHLKKSKQSLAVQAELLLLAFAMEEVVELH
jgi:hypothetical protein